MVQNELLLPLFDQDATNLPARIMTLAPNVKVGWFRIKFWGLSMHRWSFGNRSLLRMVGRCRICYAPNMKWINEMNDELQRFFFIV